MRTIILAGLLAAAWSTTGALAYDKNEAKRMLKRHKCFNCHSVTRKKDGPSYQEVAAKYRDHPDPRQALFDHLTTNPTVTVNGNEESHTSIKVKDTDKINNLIEWVLDH